MDSATSGDFGWLSFPKSEQNGAVDYNEVVELRERLSVVEQYLSTLADARDVQAVGTSHAISSAQVARNLNVSEGPQEDAQGGGKVEKQLDSKSMDGLEDMGATSDNAYGAFIYSSMHNSIFLAFHGFGLMVIVSCMTQSVFTYYLWKIVRQDCVNSRDAWRWQQRQCTAASCSTDFLEAFAVATLSSGAVMWRQKVKEINVSFPKRCLVTETCLGLLTSQLN
ncbi:hypothetical protein GUITHDRAFT_143128 [Guillardia theta CCMP2712]|uniref:Uncharacterized protein n=1 Tax=Guillardia theta (strain CCMP2712) TaxID=905079 RepID=L1IVV1_GUITC|nr:hypothetical protein GUITHDRAFT_143128 [Guillardia theta CCMP2712]EKX39970.1 hypothetical protein GUITHDRAFT_143128 [Guillardia theta CCMP2712]|eukprot:XP_005826950.1 hypothetical protein GUITHDRAFT_143128 [Guillardia theta CCMP2712]